MTLYNWITYTILSPKEMFMIYNFPCGSKTERKEWFMVFLFSFQRPVVMFFTLTKGTGDSPSSEYLFLVPPHLCVLSILENLRTSPWYSSLSTLIPLANLVGNITCMLMTPKFTFQAYTLSLNF